MTIGAGIMGWQPCSRAVLHAYKDSSLVSFSAVTLFKF